MLFFAQNQSTKAGLKRRTPRSMILLQSERVKDYFKVSIIQRGIRRYHSLSSWVICSVQAGVCHKTDICRAGKDGFIKVTLLSTRFLFHFPFFDPYLVCFGVRDYCKTTVESIISYTACSMIHPKLICRKKTEGKIIWIMQNQRQQLSDDWYRESSIL